MTLGTSMAARQGPVAMAAHQICLQVWLAVSLLTDALATSGQVLSYSLCKSFYVGSFHFSRGMASLISFSIVITLGYLGI